MPKRVLLFMLSVALALAACQEKTPAPSSPSPTATQTLASGASQAQPTSTVLAQAATTSTQVPGCTVISLQPTPGPTEQSLFPPHLDTDWVKGPDTASVTIIEYSDFQ